MYSAKKYSLVSRSIPSMRRLIVKTLGASVNTEIAKREYQTALGTEVPALLSCISSSFLMDGKLTFEVSINLFSSYFVNQNVFILFDFNFFKVLRRDGSMTS